MQFKPEKNHLIRQLSLPKRLHEKYTKCSRDWGCRTLENGKNPAWNWQEFLPLAEVCTIGRLNEGTAATKIAAPHLLQTPLGRELIKSLLQLRETGCWREESYKMAKATPPPPCWLMSIAREHVITFRFRGLVDSSSKRIGWEINRHVIGCITKRDFL